MSLRPGGAEDRQIDVDSFEAEVVSLPDVRAVRVVADPRGRITEVHVIAEGGKSAKSLVRDVQTVAQARFGLDLDHRIVSVVQFGEEPLPTTSPPRPALASVAWTTDGMQSTCRVELESAAGVTSGQASGAATTLGRTRLAAQATTKALQSAYGASPVVDVVDVALPVVGERTVAVTMLVLLTGSSEQILVGSALVRTDESEAVARSILDAFNRRIPAE